MVPRFSDYWSHDCRMLYWTRNDGQVVNGVSPYLVSPGVLNVLNDSAGATNEIAIWADWFGSHWSQMCLLRCRFLSQS